MFVSSSFIINSYCHLQRDTGVQMVDIVELVTRTSDDDEILERVKVGEGGGRLMQSFLR